MVQVRFKVTVSRGDTHEQTSTIHRFSLASEVLTSYVPLLEATGVQERDIAGGTSIRYTDEEGDEICIVNEVQWEEYTINSPVGPQLQASIEPKLQRLHIQLPCRCAGNELESLLTPLAEVAAAPEDPANQGLSSLDAVVPTNQALDDNGSVRSSSSSIDGAGTVHSTPTPNAPVSPSVSTQRLNNVDTSLEPLLAPAEAPQVDSIPAEARAPSVGSDTLCADTPGTVADPIGRRRPSSHEDDDLDSSASHSVSITGRLPPTALAVLRAPTAGRPESLSEGVPTAPASPTAMGRTNTHFFVERAHADPFLSVRRDPVNPFALDHARYVSTANWDDPRQPSGQQIARRYVVLQTPTGRKYHSDYCSHSGRGPFTKLTVAEATNRGLTACRMCGGVSFLESNES